MLVQAWLASSASAVIYSNLAPAGGYAPGSVFIASPGVTYSNPLAAIGAPAPTVGAGTAYESILSPFNPAYETTHLVAFGRGGYLTLGFAAPVAITAGREIGVYTNASFYDDAYPAGTVPNPAQTAARVEYGAERTAIVEVAATPGNFVSLGRVAFDQPTNYFANATDPYAAIAPPGAVSADFGKPFAQTIASLAGKSFADYQTALDGSAGGTWIDVPTTIGLTEVNYVRFSDPMWKLDDGTLVEQRASIYDAAWIKPADLFIDAVAGVGVPEPSSLALLALGGLAMARRRGR